MLVDKTIREAVGEGRRVHVEARLPNPGGVGGGLADTLTDVAANARADLAPFRYSFGTY